MLCLLYAISRLVNTYLFAFTLLLALAGGSLSIAYGVKILDELAILSFSNYLDKSIAHIAGTVGITIGVFILVISLLGIFFLTPFYKKWMFYIYSPVALLCFAILFGLATYVYHCGHRGAELIEDYCNDNFERWTKLQYGQFVVQLDNSYTELERNLLCSSTCPCVSINYNIWNSSSVISNQYNAKLEYQSKYFNGSALNVLGCLNVFDYNKTYDHTIVQYFTEIEKKHACAGVCQTLFFYPFTNVVIGPPPQSCLQFIIEDFRGHSGTYRKYTQAFFIAGSFILISWFVSFGLCYRKTSLWQFKVSVVQDQRQ